MVHGVMPKQFFIESVMPAVAWSFSFAMRNKHVAIFVRMIQVVRLEHVAAVRRSELEYCFALPR